MSCVNKDSNLICQNESQIVLAIHCLVYNHEPYLRDCFEGFVIQKTNFRFVAVVHDDCSTDHSADIIREYTEKYPDIFRSIYETENQYSKHNGSIGKKMNAAIDAIGAKYVAMCEGDDYWTDPYKLQKQVDFLEAHPDYSMCFTNSIVKYPDHELIAINHVWDTYTIEDIIQCNALNVEERRDNIQSCGHTSSVLYRRPKDGLPNWISKCYIGDEPLFIALGQYGKAKFINVIATVYRAGVGVSSYNFDYEADWSNRIRMYEVINKGLSYQYKSIINPIIAEYHYKLYKLYTFHKKRKEAFSHICKALAFDKNILLKRIIKRKS